ncbi:sensor domain-containing diguanylate cyclase [Pseudidiomarina aestuarii]|uniref:Sensor domain-containing diguanylate cyclase n=1 Tax=Pseudidiomarina aestuarii TaxID=624146 RepID=A0A7Z6ZSF6_9GAMM|nr:sensor domain-containing diguanylate cyclase [Pseudidiomarina aestuarii]RUO39485.1 sensor domain-containing diguanylate cyclase [Pseudidiomarina aestuarii]
MDWRTFIEAMPGVVYRLRKSPDGYYSFPYISPLVADWFGVSATTLKDNAAPLLTMIHPNDVDPLIAASDRAAIDNTDWSYEFRMLKPSGETVWLEAYNHSRARADGSLEWTGYLNDISERKRLERELAVSELRFRTFVENANDIIYTVSAEGELTYLSPNWEKLLGYSVSASLSKPFTDFVHPDDVGRCYRFLESVLAEDHKYESVEYRVRHRAGHWQWHTSTASMVTEADGSTKYYLGIARDVTTQKKQMEKIAKMAQHDMLTELPNRTYFGEILEHNISRATRKNRALAVLFIDLDKFKPVNDSHGHAIGDELLIAVAGRLRKCLRAGDVACRAGGDEFIALLNDLDPQDQTLNFASMIAERIRAELADPFDIEDLHLSVTASIGIASFPHHAQQLGDLLRAADQAMYVAKNEGRNCVRMAQTEANDSSA